MSRPKKKRLVDVCIMCLSKNVKEGFCRDCGHLSQYANSYVYKQAKKAKEPKAFMKNGALWKLPTRNSGEYE